MTDRVLTVVEMRAADLLTALTAAVCGNPRGRMSAASLLREINDLVLPPLATEALRETDARKRAAEILDDAY